MRTLMVVLVTVAPLFSQASFSGTSMSAEKRGAAGAAPGTITTMLTTNTQAVLAYTASSGGPCLVEASESPTYSPLIHDVDPALYGGSNSDAAPGNLTNGTARLVVLGKRNVAAATDGSNYSRALQALTPHYVRVNCSGTILTGQFTTSNIPLGNTYADLPPALAPTFSMTDRTQRIVDPHSGALIKRVSLFQDQVSAYSGINGAFMNFSGFTRMCGDTLVGPGPGYLCSYANGDGTYGLIYYIIPATGEARFLGMVNGQIGAYPKIDPIDNKIYATSGGSILRFTYAGGDYSDVGPGGNANLTSEVFIPSTPAALAVAFNPAFKTYGGTGSFTAEGQYGLMTFNSGVQDSYGSIAVLDMGNRLPIGSCGPDPMVCPHMVAAANASEQPATRWIGLHTILLVPGQPTVFVSTHELDGNNDGNMNPGLLGLGPYYSSLTADLTSGGTALVIDGEPAALGAPDAHFLNWSVGDYLMVGQGAGHEKMRITAKADANHVTVSRTGSGTFAAGTKVIATVAGNWIFYWNFLSDPLGSDTTNTALIQDPDWPLGGHDDWGPNLRLTEKYFGVKGPFEANLKTPLNFHLTDSPTFAGVFGMAYGNSFTSHLSYHQVGVTAPNDSFFMEMLPFNGDDTLFHGSFTAVGGTLWKLLMPNGPNWNRKIVPTAGVSGKTTLLDISGPSSVISPNSTDNYKYCVVVAPGECYAGSVTGEIYANVPSSTGSCRAGGSNDLCFFSFPMYGQAITQLGLADTTNAAFSRVLSNGFAPIRGMFEYGTAKSLPNATWAMFGHQDRGLWDTGHVPAWTTQQTNSVFLVKLPPFSSQDAVDRSTFVHTQPIAIAPPQGQGITTAAIEFGYAEFGTPAEHYCTSRKEACVAVVATPVDANPFQFASETYTRLACTVNCSIVLPIIPVHSAYWQVRYYDGAGAFVSNGKQGVTSEGTVITLP